MTSSSERLLQKKSWLAAAELAEFQLATGAKKVQLSVAMPATGTQMTAFTPATMPALMAYIARLKSDIAELEGDDSNVPCAIHWA